MALDTPILFLIFNRPELTAKVFQEISKARPKTLYVAADGSRSNIEGEEEKVLLVREIATKVDWECEVKTLFRDQNLGCKKAVSNAITWFFENEEEGIILEDDCLPDQSFFPFCKELLKKYRDDNRVMAISGDNFQNGESRTQYSYYFSRYPHCWGWATWKRSWVYWDGNLSTWHELKSSFFHNSIEKRNSSFHAYWNKIFDLIALGKIDSWNYPWIYSCWVQSGLTVLPNKNLVSNIGFGEDSTHTKDDSGKDSRVPTEKISLPLKHPSYIIRNADADNFFEQNILGLSEIQKNGIPKNSFIQRLLNYFKKKVKLY